MELLPSGRSHCLGEKEQRERCVIALGKRWDGGVYGVLTCVAINHVLGPLRSSVLPLTNGVIPPVLEEGNRHVSKEMVQMKGNGDQSALGHHPTTEKGHSWPEGLIPKLPSRTQLSPG